VKIFLRARREEADGGEHLPPQQGAWGMLSGGAMVEVP